mgnify:FL=1
MRSDVLNKNSQHTDWKKKVELIGVARTLTEVDSGKEFYLESSGGAFSITLPTGADIEDGVNYKFWVQENTPTAAITLAAGSAIVFGKINETEVDTGDDGPGSSADGATGVSNVILGTSALKGDFIELDAYGGHWFLNGQSGKDGAVTTS